MENRSLQPRAVGAGILKPARGGCAPGNVRALEHAMLAALRFRAADVERVRRIGVRAPALQSAVSEGSDEPSLSAYPRI